MATQNAGEVHSKGQQCSWIGGRQQPSGHLLVVSSYQAEDVTSICYGQEVTEEEGQASVEAFSQLHVLMDPGDDFQAHRGHQGRDVIQEASREAQLAGSVQSLVQEQV